VIGLLVGMIVAASTKYTDCNDGVCTSYRYVTGQQISDAKWITFLWTKRIPLGFYGPAVLPVLLAFMVTTMECIGDITATTEASHLEPYGEKFERRIQGGVVADGINSFFGALAFITPVTTYAQNNGVISLSRCASRYAGYACCAWLMLFGIIGKFAAIILTIPNCVIGAMTTFLFTGVVVSGIHVLNLREGLTRRNRFIAIMSIGVGMGVILIPAWVNITGQFVDYPFEGNFWPVNPNWSPAFRGFRDSLIIVMSNGFSIGGFIALILNLILPFDQNDGHGDQTFEIDDSTHGKNRSDEKTPV
jgi:uracil-xanthine permease